MHIEHIIPTAVGGRTEPDNLAYACRTQRWLRHFTWSLDGVLVTGRTRAGRATVIALHMNHPTVVMSRSFWVRLGMHPPDVA
jgi:hypothetical protein